ncbi:hypothetical protein [Lacinutrix venerupis]|nr:hypothetical protein [Lacinutrix venerupis]
MGKFLFYINDVLESLDIHISKKSNVKVENTKRPFKNTSKEKYLEKK